MKWNNGREIQDGEMSLNEAYLEELKCADSYKRMMKANLWDKEFETFLRLYA